MNRGEAARWAFIDEYGNANLDTSLQDVSTLFIVTAVLVRDDELEPLRDVLAKIRSRFFQSGKMESKARWLRRGNATTWEPLVNALAEVDFRFYALAVDKDRLAKDGGFRFGKSFYKNLCGRAYRQVMAASPNLNVRADRYGDLEFKESFADYVERNHRPTLFHTGSFDWADEGDPLPQLADVICGLLARCYDPKKAMSGARALLGKLRKHALLFDEWPARFRLGGETPMPSNQEADTRISEYSVLKAQQFLDERGEERDPVTRCQVGAVEYLLSQQRFGLPGESIFADALNQHLLERSLPTKGTTWLRHEVIAGLRDTGVVVTSSPTGYRLPTSAADFRVFAKHAESVCLPMLDRVRKACDVAKLVTMGEVNVLGEPASEALAALTAAARKSRGGKGDDDT